MTTLFATTREKIGSKASKVYRADGKLPAVLYGGAETQATALLLDAREFEKVWREAGETTVCTLETPNGRKDVLINDVSVDPIYGTALHVDLYAVRTDVAVEVDVPLEFSGVAPAEKELGGTLVKVMHELTISALPKDLPHAIVVDVSVLKTFDDQVLVSTVSLPQGVTAIAEPDEVVALVQAQREEELSEDASDVTSVEVEKKGKEEERQ